MSCNTKRCVFVYTAVYDCDVEDWKRYPSNEADCTNSLSVNIELKNKPLIEFQGVDCKAVGDINTWLAPDHAANTYGNNSSTNDSTWVLFAAWEPDSSSSYPATANCDSLTDGLDNVDWDPSNLAVFNAVYDISEEVPDCNCLASNLKAGTGATGTSYFDSTQQTGEGKRGWLTGPRHCDARTKIYASYDPSDLSEATVKAKCDTTGTATVEATHSITTTATASVDETATNTPTPYASCAYLVEVYLEESSNKYQIGLRSNSSCIANEDKHLTGVAGTTQTWGNYTSGSTFAKAKVEKNADSGGQGYECLIKSVPGEEFDDTRRFVAYYHSVNSLGGATFYNNWIKITNTGHRSLTVYPKGYPQGASPPTPITVAPGATEIISNAWITNLAASNSSGSDENIYRFDVEGCASCEETFTHTASHTDDHSFTATATTSQTPTVTFEATHSITTTDTPTSTATDALSDETPTNTASGAGPLGPWQTSSATHTIETSTHTLTFSPTVTVSHTPTLTVTPGASSTATSTASVYESATATATQTIETSTFTPTHSPTSSELQTSTEHATATASEEETSTATQSATPTLIEGTKWVVLAGANSASVKDPAYGYPDKTAGGNEGAAAWCTSGGTPGAGQIWDGGAPLKFYYNGQKAFETPEDVTLYPNQPLMNGQNAVGAGKLSPYGKAFGIEPSMEMPGIYKISVAKDSTREGDLLRVDSSGRVIWYGSCPQASSTATATATQTIETATATLSVEATATASIEETATATISATASVEETATATTSVEATATATATASVDETATHSPTSTITFSPSATHTITATPTVVAAVTGDPFVLVAYQTCDSFDAGVVQPTYLHNDKALLAYAGMPEYNGSSDWGWDTSKTLPAVFKGAKVGSGIAEQCWKILDPAGRQSVQVIGPVLMYDNTGVVRFWNPEAAHPDGGKWGDSSTFTGRKKDGTKTFKIDPNVYAFNKTHGGKSLASFTAYSSLYAACSLAYDNTQAFGHNDIAAIHTGNTFDGCLECKNITGGARSITIKDEYSDSKVSKTLNIKERIDSEGDPDTSPVSAVYASSAKPKLDGEGTHTLYIYNMNGEINPGNSMKIAGWSHEVWTDKMAGDQKLKLGIWEGTKANTNIFQANGWTDKEAVVLSSFKRTKDFVQNINNSLGGGLAIKDDSVKAAALNLTKSRADWESKNIFRTMTSESSINFKTTFGAISAANNKDVDGVLNWVKMADSATIQGSYETPPYNYVLKVAGVGGSPTMWDKSHLYNSNTALTNTHEIPIGRLDASTSSASSNLLTSQLELGLSCTQSSIGQLTPYLSSVSLTRVDGAGTSVNVGPEALFDGSGEFAWGPNGNVAFSLELRNKAPSKYDNDKANDYAHYIGRGDTATNACGNTMNIWLNSFAAGNKPDTSQPWGSTHANHCHPGLYYLIVEYEVANTAGPKDKSFFGSTDTQNEWPGHKLKVLITFEIPSGHYEEPPCGKKCPLKKPTGGKK